MIRATVITDASWCPRTNAGGWAAWVVVNYTRLHVERCKRFGTFQKLPKSSEQAERWAAWNGIWLAYQHGAREILCQTDCLAVVQNLYGGATDIRDKHWPDISVKTRHVKGHTTKEHPRYYVNRWCDKHAKAEMRKLRGQIR